MAYRRRSSTRRRSYTRGRTTYRSRASRPARRGRTRRVSSRRGSPRTIRIVVQTVGTSPTTNQSQVAPLRAMF